MIVCGPGAVDQLLTKGVMMINFAHRGASQYAPENTMVSFHMGVDMGADGIETDVQKSKDGVLVLFHDDTMKRTLSVDGSISDFTWEELQRFDAGAFKGEKYKGTHLVSLEEFMKAFGASGLHLAIEIKQKGIEIETLEMIRRYADDRNFTITSFMFDSIRCLAEYDNPPQLGYLARTYSEELLDQLVSLGIDEYCPDAAFLTAEMMRRAEEKGLRVRAWGVKTPELMDKMVELGVYGMTVNFPDLLYARLNNESA